MGAIEVDNEEHRVKALRKYQILDTPPNGNFDRLTALAAKIFNVPICIISLVDSDRIWFKSHHGLQANEIGREPGLCASAIFSDDVYVVENAKEDPRTLTNSLVVSDFGLRFYAAAPLTTLEGYNLGTFCIIDRKQRYITEAQKEILRDLSKIAMDEIEVRLAARDTAAKTNQILEEARINLQHIIQDVEQLAEVDSNVKVQEQINLSREILRNINSLLIRKVFN